MKLKEIQVIEYAKGEEEALKKILYKSKEPLLIKIKDFPDTFTLDYFEERIDSQTSYDVYGEEGHVSHVRDNFKSAIAAIKQNKPHRIFGEILPINESEQIEAHIPLWESIPTRPRYFDLNGKVVYFFGGKGSNTGIHYDREQCSNLHVCLCGTKQLLLFTKEQNDHLYKVPYIGDSLIDFSEAPLAVLEKKYPLLAKAEGYLVTIKQGDMIFMPRHCWHYTSYIDASAAATYSFFPHKFHHYWGVVTGHFYMAYKEKTGMGVGNWKIFRSFSRYFAYSSGITKSILKGLEVISYAILLPILSIQSYISLRFWPRRLY